VWSAADECDRPGDVTRRAVIGDHVVYEDEFIYDASLDEVDSVDSSTDDDEDFVLFTPVRLNLISSFLLSFISRSYCYAVWSAIDIMSSVGPSVRPSVCLSVNLSVTLYIVALRAGVQD